MTCNPSLVAPGNSSTCVAVATDPAYVYVPGSIKLANGAASSSCRDDTSEQGKCDLSGINSDVTVGASFKLREFNLTQYPTSGGLVSCSPNVVQYGSSSTCRAVPDTGYSYTPDSLRKRSGKADISCSGATCTLSNVRSNVIMQASFTPDKYSVTDATPTGAGGTMDLSSATQVTGKTGHG